MAIRLLTSTESLLSPVPLKSLWFETNYDRANFVDYMLHSCRLMYELCQAHRTYVDHLSNDKYILF